MKKLKAYKFRLYPNKTQEVLLNKTFGCVRYFWNSQVQAFNNSEGFKTSTALRNEFEWMKEVSAAAIQQKEIDFKQFKKQFFNTKRKVKLNRPNFKKKSSSQSYRLPNQKFKINKNRIQLEKIGKIKFVQDRSFPENYKFISATISRNSSDQYFVSILVEQEIKYFEKTQKEVGIDVGVKSFSVQSDGIEICNPKFFSKNQAKLKRLQQHFSRKTKGSNRREKCRKKISRLYQKITNQRDYFLHNYSSFLIKNYDFIAIEDLNVKDLLEKKLMSKEISDVSWSKFFQMLEYKADWYGKTLHKIDRYFASSKTCSKCNYVYEDLKLSERKWECKSCGEIHDRDLNASKNIIKSARVKAVKTNVETKVTRSMKR